MGDWSKNGDFYRRNEYRKTISFHIEHDADIIEWIEQLPPRSLTDQLRMLIREKLTTSNTKDAHR